jgi:hypothetical protein
MSGGDNILKARVSLSDLFLKTGKILGKVRTHILNRIHFLPLGLKNSRKRKERGSINYPSLF